MRLRPILALAFVVALAASAVGGGFQGVQPASYAANLELDFHYLQRLEVSAATGVTTWLGSPSSSNVQTGLVGRFDQ
jgi:hypothetical protein